MDVPACLVLKNRKEGVEYIEIDVEEFLTSLFCKSVISLCLTLGVLTSISTQRFETNYNSLERGLQIISTWIASNPLILDASFLPVVTFSYTENWFH